ncbi:MAG: DUF4159 domain-containing protein [Maricaulaceae bacterium]|jgi:hypothetical protein
MMTLGPLAFAAPIALAGLLALPLVWLLLRAAPPAPKRRMFPPFRLLMGLSSEEETQERTPWWLVLLRLILAALVIFALARPILFPPQSRAGECPLVLVVDDGWASAPGWDRAQRDAEARIAAAGRDGCSVAVLFTAPRRTEASVIELLSANEARALVASHEPAPWPTDRSATAARLNAAIEAGDIPSGARPEWLADGVEEAVDEGGALTLARVLDRLGPGEMVEPSGARAPLALDPPRVDGEGFTVRVRRAYGELEREGAVLVLDEQGRSLARTPYVFEPGAETAEATAVLPLELRNEARLVGLEGERSAGGVQVLDDRWRRATVGLASSAGAEDRQPLLADLYYVETALETSADTRRAPLNELLDEPPSAIVLVDAGRVVGADSERLLRYVEDGGLLIRFAGPRLAVRADDLVPTPLRAGDRALGGAMAWDDPQPLAPFEPDSPFFGIELTEETTVTRQVLADPNPDLAERTWARLTDGTPLVTSARRGQGRIVLFHVTAAPGDWSNIPLSGVFGQMLERTLAFADARPTAQEVAAGDWRLESALEADGRLGQPLADLGAVSPEDFAEARASAATPPGLWARPGEARAVNVIAAGDEIAPIPNLPAGLARISGAERIARPLAGPLLALALLLFAVDAIAVAALAGMIKTPRALRRAGAAAASVAAAGFIALAAPVSEARAQDALDGAARTEAPAVGDPQLDEDWVLSALDRLHLAYVLSGDGDIDRMSEAGLRGLSAVLNDRTTVEPINPIGVDIERDPFEVLPMLYWPVTPDTQAPSPETAARIDAYLKSGGVIIFDTQDAGSSAVFGAAPHPGLSRIIEAIDVPALAPVGPEHVMTKAYYLLQEFPGRWRDATLWVVAPDEQTTLDGVSPVVVTSADWASAWAIDDQGRAVAAVSSGDEHQRELARRTGVNLVMYVLTGNYKADQVHATDIMDRMNAQRARQ